MAKGDITPDDVPNDVVLQTALWERLSRDWDFMGDLAEACVARLRSYGRVIVRAEDVRAVLGPDPGITTYVESGKRLLAAIEPPTPIDDKEGTTR